MPSPISPSRPTASTHIRLRAVFSSVPRFSLQLPPSREHAQPDVSWRPLSPLHLAPMALTWDRDLGRIMTRERRERLLTSRRACLEPARGRTLAPAAARVQPAAVAAHRP